MAGGVMEMDHFTEAESLLRLAGEISPTDRPYAMELLAAAQVNATLAATFSCGDEPLTTWGDLMVAASDVWSDGGAPPFPKLVAFAEALGLVVVERDARDADADPA